MANLPIKLLETLNSLAHFDEKSFVQVHKSDERLTSVRLNPFKHVELDFTSNEKVTWCNNAYYLPQRPVFTADPLFHAGAYYVQEAGSMFLETVLTSILDTNTKQTVLDLCAAPGGKSTLINSILTKDSVLVANEVIKQRASVLSMNLSKWGTSNTIVTNNDPSHFNELREVFDAIVIDAPCSGSGLFRKQPEAIDEWSEENVMLCEARQKRIVADVIPSLKAEGYIVYSTCSYSMEENEQQVEWMEKELGLSYKPLQISIPEGVVDTGKGYRFYPNKVKSEGFFIAILQKTETSIGSNQQRGEKLSLPSNKERQVLQPYFKKEAALQLFSHQTQYKVINTTGFQFLERYGKKLYIKKAGVTLGEIKHNEFIPDHEWAWSVDKSTAITEIELTLEEALLYLKKENLFPEHAKACKGLVQINYKGLGIGLAKMLNNRLNNYLPNAYRILDKTIG